MSAESSNDRSSRRNRSRLWILAVLVIAISSLHWITPLGGTGLHATHVVMRKLFILPVVLGGIWFGLRGGALAALAATVGYLPFIVVRWAGQDLENLNQIGELVSLWAIGIIAGFLAGRETRRLAGAAEAARLERERLEGVVDSAGVGMMQVDPDISLRWHSGRVAQWLRRFDLASGGTCPLFRGSDACATCVARASFESGRTASAERFEVGPGGAERVFRHTATPVRDRSGRAVQVVEVIEDITARRALEEETIRSEKLSVLGRMASGIAHEIGNPLSSISTRLRLLEKRRDESFVAQSVEVLREQIARITRIVDGVSHFGRVRRRERAVFAINELVGEIVGIVELDPRAQEIRFDQRLEEPSPNVLGVRDQIAQILLNLLLNAVEASGPGTTVVVRSQSERGVLRLAVDDEGPGIPPGDRDRLFEPFFTTKPGGTGLGLSISFGFATAHGGTIEVGTTAAGGASLVLVLPADDSASTRAQTPLGETS